MSEISMAKKRSMLGQAGGQNLAELEPLGALREARRRPAGTPVAH